MIRTRTVRPLLALALAAALGACQREPVTVDPPVDSVDPAALVGTWETRLPAVEITVNGTARQVRSMESWTFGVNNAFRFRRWLADPATGATLAEVFVGEGDYEVRGATLHYRPLRQSIPAPGDTWSPQLAMRAVEEPRTWTATLVLDGDELHVVSTCGDTASCAPPLAFFRVD